MKKLALASIALSVFLGACAGPGFTVSDYPGNYYGVLPCADCGGIQTDLNLYPDRTYRMRETYINPPQTVIINNPPPVIVKNQPPVFETKGQWTPTKKHIDLAPEGQPDRPHTYYAPRKGNVMEKLDANAQPIKSKFNYQLNRKK